MKNAFRGKEAIYLAAAAKKLVGLEAKMVMSARREDILKDLTAELGENVMYVVTDVAKRADLLAGLTKWMYDNFVNINHDWLSYCIYHRIIFNL